MAPRSCDMRDKNGQIVPDCLQLPFCYILSVCVGSNRGWRIGVTCIKQFQTPLDMGLDFHVNLSKEGGVTVH